MDHPRIRPLEAVQFEHEGQVMVHLRDPACISRAMGALPLPAFFLITLMDGQHSVLDMQSEFTKRTGTILEAEIIRKLIGQLEEMNFLEGDKFDSHLRGLLASPTRAVAHTPGDAAAVRAQIDGYFRAAGGPGPLPPPSTRGLRAVMSPHIDFHRGNVTYAHTWHAAARFEPADLYLVLGTCHFPMRQPFGVSARSYDTPFGPLPTDVGFVSALERKGCGWSREDEVRHIGEHSIEFQAVMLRYLHGARPIQAVPILVGGFHEEVRAGKSPSSGARFQEFTGALLESMKESGKRVCLVAGVDLAHVGPNFDDPDPVTPGIAAQVEKEDREMLAAVEAIAPEAFYANIQKDSDRRHVCGFGPIYTMLSLLSKAGPVKGTLVRYAQAEAPSASIVSFAGATFEAVDAAAPPL